MLETTLLSSEGHRLVAASASGVTGRSGLPVVFIHGILGSVHFWEHCIPPQVASGRRWYSLSLPGHYPAVVPPGFGADDLTPEMMARVMAGALRELFGSQPVLLVGHSTGGFAALNLAIRAQDQVAGVISVSGFAHGRWIGSLGMSQRLARSGPLGRLGFWLLMRALSLSGTLCYHSTRYYAADWPTMRTNPCMQASRAASYAMFRQADLGALQHYFRRMPDIDITADLRQIVVPVLALNGDCDPIVPSAQSRIIAEQVQNGQHISLPGCGHMPMFERTTAYADAIDTWITARGVS